MSLLKNFFLILLLIFTATSCCCNKKSILIETDSCEQPIIGNCPCNEKQCCSFECCKACGACCGCECETCLCCYPWDSLRRPEVIGLFARWILDFNDMCPCKDNETQSNENENRIPPEYLDQFRPQVEVYHIARGDLLEISVVGDEDTLVESVEIAPDGRLYYAFLESFVVEGLTLDQLKAEIETRMTPFFIHPIVSIIPKLMTAQKFIVLGRVKKPGVFPLSVSMTLRQAIGLAGGLLLEPDIIQGGTGGLFFLQTYSDTKQSISDLQNSFVVRKGKKLNIDFEKLMKSPDPSQDIYIQPGDYIYIAATDKREVYVLGGVNQAKAIRYKDGLTMMGSLAQAGGWTKGSPYSADMHNVLVVRGSLDCPCVMHVDLQMILCGTARDIYMCPGDILYVHNKQFRFGRELVRIAVWTFVQSFSTAAGSQIGGQLF